MKLVNYKLTTPFDCSIHGTIYMSFSEWQEALKYLSDNRKQLDPYGGTFLWDVVIGRTVRGYSNKKWGFHSLGVTPTEMIVEHFKLDRYKRGNYQIAVAK